MQQALAQGVVAGFPLQDLRVVVHDGKHHSVDSKEVAFFSAGRKAFLDAVAQAAPQLLEPIVGSDGGRGGEMMIRAHLPMAELDGFPAELKSLTAGRGRYDIEFSHYEPAPAPLQAKRAATWKPRAEED